MYDWDKAIEAANQSLAEVGLKATIDEVAVMFRGKPAAWQFLETVVAAGGKLFNAATDKVETFPLESDYLVDYLFAELPGGRFYRLECMVLQQGHSPLHAALDRSVKMHPLEPTVHYSFKTYGAQEYTDACGNLMAGGWERAQSCLSTYGMFSYWHMGDNEKQLLKASGFDWDANGAYIKPRANMRDEQPYMSRKAI